MKKPQSLILSLLVLAFLPWGASAHHSIRVHFDRGGQGEIIGVLKDVRMRSPHSLLTVDVTDENGEVTTWDVETHAIALMKRVGVTAETFTIGETITVRGMPSRTEGKPLIFGLVFILHDGQQYSWAPDTLVPEGGLSEGRLVATVTGLERFEGVWGYEVVPNPHINADSPYPLAQAGLDARANFNPLDTSAMRCIPPNLPSLLYAPYLVGIDVSSDRFSIQHEYFSILREVPLGGDAVQADSTGLYGSAVGRVEGDTVIIESAEFPDLESGMASAFDPNGVGADVPSSTQKEFTERYTLSEDGNTLMIEYSIVDPVYLTEAFAGSTQWVRLAEGTEIVPFECDTEMAAQPTSQGGTDG